MQKLILLFAIAFMNLQAEADINESKIFLDKYSIGIEKVKKEININDNADISTSKLFKDINISDSIRTDAKNIFENRLVDENTENAAKADAKVIHSDKFKKQFREAKDNLLYDKKLGWGEQAAIAEQYVKSQQEKGEQNFYFNSKETIYIFISSSLPKETIENYLESTKYIQDNVVFVMQGAIGGMQKIKPTLQWIKELIGEKYANAKIVIDPRLSEHFNIKQVPAILYTQKDFFEMKSQEIQSANAAKADADTYIFYGDMPIGYVIKKMNEKKQSSFLQNILKKLETK